MTKRRPIRLNDEQRKLVEENIGLVIYTLRKEYGHDYASDDDNIAEGMYALCRAAACFDVSTGAKFSSYAYRAIANWPKVLARNANMYKRKVDRPHVSLDAPARIDGQKELGKTVGDLIRDNRPGPDERAEETINAEVYRGLILQIANEYPLVVAALQVEKRSAYFTAIANRENVCRQAVDSRYQRQRRCVLKKYAKEYRRIMYGGEDDRGSGENVR